MKALVLIAVALLATGCTTMTPPQYALWAEQCPDPREPCWCPGPHHSAEPVRDL
jgi:hypothetical protein